MLRTTVIIMLVSFSMAHLQSADWRKLITGPDLAGWDVVGDGVWTVMSDGTLVGQRHLKRKSLAQSWLYSKEEFGEFDLHLEWWLRLDGNSGVSIRDSSRAQYAVGPQFDPKRTPSHIGYEIQIDNGDDEQFPSGSVYLFDKAKGGEQRNYDWNALDIEARKDMIRVKVNGRQVSQSGGDPARPKNGPIGFQLHDHNTVVMFRDVRIRELSKP